MPPYPIVRMRLAPPLLAIALAACAEPPRVEFGPCVPERVTHVRYFGYFASAASLGELAPYSNLSWGSGAKTLSDARAAGVHAVVNAESVFEPTVAVPSADGVIAANWTALADLLRPDLAALAALYVSDEPYMNGEKNGVAPAEVQRRLEAAAKLIHSTPGFEQVPLAIILSDPCVQLMEAGSAGMPAGYAWVGWDFYGHPIDRIEARATVFLGFVRPDQRLIAIPDAFVWRANPDVTGLETRIAFWLAWIEVHPEVVAVVPFIYASSADWYGAQDLPDTRARYQQIGTCILDARALR